MLETRQRRNRVGQRRVNTKTQYYALEGGLDVVTPPLTIRPGSALAMVNFEPWYQGGYRRVPGYERFDGSPKPSDATFTGFEVSTVAGLTLRDVITGDTLGIVTILQDCLSWDSTNNQLILSADCNAVSSGCTSWSIAWRRRVRKWCSYMVI